MTTNIYFLLATFLTLSAFDLLTTWLDLFKLPKELRGQESNPVFGDMILQWKKNAIWKITATLLIALAAWKRNDIFPLQLINITLLLVVLNNAYIFFTRKYLKRKTATLGSIYSHGFKILHLPQKLAYFAIVGTLIVISWGLALLIR